MIMNYGDNAKKYGLKLNKKGRKAENSRLKCDQIAFSWKILKHKLKHRQYKNIITTFFVVAQSKKML